MSDETNPIYLFSSTYTELLVKVAKGEIDPTQLAHAELMNRGMNLEGEWIGFDEAKKIYNAKWGK